MALPTIDELLKAGVHFGHQTRRWNPKMRRFIFAERNGIHIIDLQKTLDRLQAAQQAVRGVVLRGERVLFVCTKKQLRPIIEQEAQRSGSFFVTERWLGGMLTNFGTISKRVTKMIELERLAASPEWAQIPKKEALLMSRELAKLQRNLSGIRNMVRPPDAIFVLDTQTEHLAVTEANKLGIPVIAVVDTNVNPDLVQFPIPGNDDAIRANELMTRVIAEAIVEGRFIAEKAGGQVQNPGTAAVDNAVFAAEQARARAEAAAAQAARDAKLAGGAN